MAKNTDKTNDKTITDEAKIKADLEAKIRAELEEKIKTETEAKIRAELEEKKKKNSKSKSRKRIDPETVIVIKNNTSGGIWYRDPKTLTLVDLEGYGDTAEITVGELNTLRSMSKIVDYLTISVVDIFSDEFTIEDMIANLGLIKKYEALDVADYVLDFDKIILDNDSTAFASIFMKSEPIIQQRLKDASLYLKRIGRLNDLAKVTFIENAIEKK